MSCQAARKAEGFIAPIEEDQFCPGGACHMMMKRQESVSYTTGIVLLSLFVIILTYIFAKKYVRYVILGTGITVLLYTLMIRSTIEKFDVKKNKINTIKSSYEDYIISPQIT
jgi:hypothetical protein